MVTFKNNILSNSITMNRSTIHDHIIYTLSSLGSGATIQEIAASMHKERHTISKYLSLLESQNILIHKEVGKAKLWFINKAPLQTVLTGKKKSFMEMMLSEIIAGLPLGLVMIDKEYSILFMNKNAEEAYGRCEGQKFYSAIMKKENPMMLKKINSVIISKQDRTETYLVDGIGRHLLIRASRLMQPDKSFSIILLLEDISAQKNAQDEIERQKVILIAERAALNRSAIVAETDTKGIITYVNDKFTEISGYKRNELLGKTHRIINSGYHPPEFFHNMWKTITAGKVWKGEIRNKAKDGRFYWVDTAIAPVLDANGKPIKYISVRFEITQRKGQES